MFIGIDPGLDGALAVIHQDGEVECFDTPTLQVGKRRKYDVLTMAMTISQFTAIAHIDPIRGVAIENVHSMPKQGVASSFTFGVGLGIWLGLTATMRVTMVSPQHWKKAMLDGQQKDKDASRYRARQLFPSAEAYLDRKKDHGRAEALLMAEWLRRQHAGKTA